MSDVRLDRADRAAARRPAAGEHLPQGLHLDGIAERRARAMGLDVADAGGRHPAERLRRADDPRLGLGARRRVSGPHRSVVVDRRAFDDRTDGIAVRQGVGQPLQEHDPDAAAEVRPPGGGVERPAMTVRRVDLPLGEEIAGLLGNPDADAAGEGQVAFAAEQPLAGQVDGDERGRAGGLHGDARPLEAELVGDARGQIVLVVGEQRLQGARQRPAGVGDEAHQIAVGTGPAVDPGDRAEPLAGIATVLQSLPCRLQKETMLGIQHLGLAGAEPEKPGVEEVHVVQHRPRPDVAGPAQETRIHPGGDQLLVGEEVDGLHPVAQVLPEPAQARCTRKTPGHPDDRDLESIPCLRHQAPRPPRPGIAGGLSAAGASAPRPACGPGSPPAPSQVPPRPRRRSSSRERGPSDG